MTKISVKIGRKYIAAWKAAAVILDDVRAKELPLIDIKQGLVSLLPAFEASVRERKPSATSGLIEQQRLFSRATIK